MIMDNKINIAELLKDCPQGMELDCTICNNRVTLEGVVGNGSTYPIRVIGKDGFHHMLTCSGGVYDNKDAKCVIFPKGKTTWEGFQRPFKDGDIVATSSGLQVFILQRMKSNTKGYCYMGYDFKSNRFLNADVWSFERLASEEEKQKLFDAIKTNGYKWNEETKTLEKLPKFKVRDRIKYIYFDRKVARVVKIHENRYELDNGKFLDFQDENAYEISYDKFDITTLKPFDKVLVRDHNAQEWVASLFSNYNEPKKYKYICVNGSGYAQCIPYENNEHLLGTTDDCDEYYKTWE